MKRRPMPRHCTRVPRLHPQALRWWCTLRGFPVPIAFALSSPPISCSLPLECAHSPGAQTPVIRSEAVPDVASRAARATQAAALSLQFDPPSMAGVAALLDLLQREESMRELCVRTLSQACIQPGSYDAGTRIAVSDSHILNPTAAVRIPVRQVCAAFAAAQPCGCRARATRTTLAMTSDDCHRSECHRGDCLMSDDCRCRARTALAR